MKVTFCCIVLCLTRLVNGLGSSEEFKDNSHPAQETSWVPSPSNVVVLVKMNGHSQRRHRPDHPTATPQLVFLVGDRSNWTTTEAQRNEQSPDPRRQRYAEQNHPLEAHEDPLSDSTSSRTARGMESESPPMVEDHPRTNLFDIVLRPRRKLSIPKIPPPPTSLAPPPVDQETSYSQLTNTPQQFTEPETEDEHHYDDSDTVPPFIVLPNLFQDWSQLLKQPLRITKIKDSIKDGSKDPTYNEQWTNRDSEDYGMIAKAPYIICPLGSRLDSLGNISRSTRSFLFVTG